uniref:Uncharacterized protein n=1 Tax=Rhizophora mucronata TaxID=61149 RepID=A0A2P2PX08_RHIMU
MEKFQILNAHEHGKVNCSSEVIRTQIKMFKIHEVENGLWNSTR